jgi:oligoendopeptidase F
MPGSKALMQKKQEKKNKLQQEIASHLSTGIWCIRILRFEYELYEAANSNMDNKTTIIAIF